jgi:hypothetical protein
MIKESGIMKEIHKIRERFYRKTKDMNHLDTLKLIKKASQKMEVELSKVKPNPDLIITKKYTVPESKSLAEIHRIRERHSKYSKSR